MRFLPLLAAALLAGCSAYQLGGPKPAFSRIEVLPIRNATARPGLQAIFQEKLVEDLGRDPRIKVGPGGAKLDVEVITYRRVGLTTKSTDAYSYSSYRVTMVARCTLTTDGGQKLLFKDREFTSVATLQLAGDSASEERSLAPGLLSDLSSQIREAATTAW
ncbi:MAG: hypothetical protein CK522_01440 [Opitutia bacterium]|nr:MAG: hypothetical protein CK522_01440 [Opitutae bacterium]